MPSLFATILRDADVMIDVADESALVRAAAAAGSAIGTGIVTAGIGQLAGSLFSKVSAGDLVPWAPLTTGLKVDSARGLNAAWERAGGEAARLSLDVDALTELGMPVETTADAFLQTAVPRGSIALIDHRGGPNGRWNWPLNIGLLPTSAGFDIAAKLAQQEMFRRGLAHLVMLGQDGDACDVLLLAEDLRSALTLGKQAALSPHAIGATVLLGGTGGFERVASALRGLRGDLFSEAAAVTRVRPHDLGRWAGGLVRELSHNSPFDVALRRAGLGGFDYGTAVLGESPGSPLLVTGPGLLDNSRISAQLPALANRLRSLPADAAIGLPTHVRSASGIGLDTAPVLAHLLADQLDTAALHYNQEIEGSSLSAAVAARVAEAEAPPGSRFADLTLSTYDESASEVGSSLADDDPLRAGSTYALGVAFRTVRKGIGVNEKREPVRPIKQGGTDLLITLAAMTEQRDPTDRIKLPEPAQYLYLPKSGDSDEALFLLEVAKDTKGRFGIEMRVFDQLNLIEWLVLHVSVGDAALGPAQIVQDVEHRELGARLEPRAVHLHIAKNDGGSYRVAVTIERSAGAPVRAEASTQIVGTGQLEEALGRVRDFWIACALDRFGKGLRADDSLRSTILRELTDLGSGLWTMLFQTGAGQVGALDNVRRFLTENAPPPGAVVQITLESNAQDFIFPWSLLYPPDPATPDADQLWGMRYVIEQQIVSKALRQRPAAAQPGTHSVGLLFGLFDSFLQSAAQRQMIADLKAQSGGRLDPGKEVENPEDLIAHLQNSDAELVYIFSHGYTPFRYEAWLGAFRDGLKKRQGDDAAASILKELTRGDFVQDDAWIELTQGKLRWRQLSRETIRLVRRPIVFLNMCRSAQVLPGLLQSFVWVFLTRAQVRSVLGTECPVSPAFADLMGQEMLPRILAGIPVGQALYQTRRDVFGRYGNPLGLAYTLWGSASAGVDPLFPFEPRRTPSDQVMQPITGEEQANV